MIRMMCGLVLLSALGACAQPANDATTTTPAATSGVGPVSLDSKPAKFSYSAGVEIGQRLQTLGDSLDLAALKLGLEHGITSAETLLSAEEMQTVKQAVYADAAAKRKVEMEAKAQQAVEKGRMFLEENASKSGVKVTESGLQYLIETAGEGAAPTAADTVVVHYRGTLLDGTEFDSSYARGEPAKFKLSAVIRGWTEGLQLLKPGGKAKLFIPADLAYGARGAGQTIGPNETLIFDVELVEVVKADPKK